MPEKEYFIILNEVTRIFVWFISDKNFIEKFVVKLQYLYNGIWYEVIRYDCSHNIVHKDILNINGDKIRIIKYPFVDEQSGLNFAINDLKENYKGYTWRFINED